MFCLWQSHLPGDVVCFPVDYVFPRPELPGAGSCGIINKVYFHTCPALLRPDLKRLICLLASKHTGLSLREEAGEGHRQKGF